MKLPKYFKKMTCEKVLICAALAVLLYSMYKYSQEKSLFSEGETNIGAGSQNVNGGGGGGGAQPARPLGQNSEPSSTQATTRLHGLPPSCIKQDVVDPKDLLPNDKNSDWSKLNPMGGGDLKGMNLLKSGHHQGIDTVGQSLRNANLQLRSEPANPQMKVGPWNNSTIEPDMVRRPLEIGAASNLSGR